MMAHEPYYICMHFCLDDFNINWIEQFLKFSEEIKKDFAIDFTHIEYSYRIPETKNKVYKYTKNALMKFNEIRQNQGISNVGFFSILDEKTYFNNPEFIVKFRNKNNRNPLCEVYVHFESNLLNRLQVVYKDYFLKILDLSRRTGFVKYAFMHPIESRKMPLLYCYGIPGDMIQEPEEAERVRIWYGNKELFTKKVRDVYLVNLLSNGHINGNKNVIEEIRLIVGSENLFEVGEGIIFYLPFDLSDWIIERREFEKTRDMVRDVLKKHGLLMEQTILTQ